MKIKKEALEKAIQESVDQIGSGSLFEEDRFAVYAGNNLEVQVVITTNTSDFIGDYERSKA